MNYPLGVVKPYAVLSNGSGSGCFVKPSALAFMSENMGWVK